jgi:hypothetical protein
MTDRGSPLSDAVSARMQNVTDYDVVTSGADNVFADLGFEKGV